MEHGVNGQWPVPAAPGSLSWADLVEQLLPHAAELFEAALRSHVPPRALELWNELEQRVRRIADSPGSGMRSPELFSADDRRRVVKEVLANLLVPDVPGRLRSLAAPEDYVGREVRRAALAVIRETIQTRVRQLATTPALQMSSERPLDDAAVDRVDAVLDKIAERDRKLLHDLANGRVTAVEIIIQQPKTAARLFVVMNRLLRALQRE